MDKEKEVFYGYRHKDWLEKEYVEEKRTMQSIADECNVTKRAIANWIHKFNIEVRKRGQVKKGDRLEAFMEGVRKKELIAEEYQRIKDFLDDKVVVVSEVDRKIRQSQKMLKLKIGRMRLNEKLKKQRQAVHSTSVPYSVETELESWQMLYDTPLKR